MMVVSSMSWATPYIRKLEAGETVQIRCRSSSMPGVIDAGQLCTVEPVGDRAKLVVGDLVLARVRGKDYLHQIHSLKEGKALIANNRGFIDGWTDVKHVYGRIIKVES